MNRIVECREVIAALLSGATGLALYHRISLPEENALLQLILLQKPALFYGIKYAYCLSLFTTPYIAFSVLFSLVYIFGIPSQKNVALVRLPAYRDPAGRKPALPGDWRSPSPHTP